jgi:hypothetical protein
MPSTTIQTRVGECPDHGRVTATRTMPAPGFPYLVYLIRRAAASSRPYRCPQCGTTVRASQR